MPPVRSHGSSVRLSPAKEDVGVLRQAALDQHDERSRDQLGVVARYRHQAPFGCVEGDRCEVRRRIRLPLTLERRNGVELVGREQVVERHHAVGQLRAEAAHIADGKHFGGHAHAELAVLEIADAAAGDQRLGADAGKRRNRIGAAPEKRERRDDHSCPQYAEHRQKIFDDVGHLHADDGVDRQAHAAQPPGDRRDHAIGLGIGEAPRRTVGEAFAIGRIGQRRRAGPPFREAAEHLVDTDADLATWLCRRVGRVAENHCSVRFGWRHHVSGR
jgi:hypothetical protein